MASDLSILGNVLNNYIVTPLQAFGLGGFVFDIEGETTVNLSTDITDHYLEDNSAVQDHIAVRPKRITLKGFVGELTYEGGESSNSVVQKVVQKLTVVNAFVPTLTAGAEQAVNVLNGENDIKLDVQGINKIADYYSFVKNITPPQSKQQQAYLYFKALMESKILISVQTPFEFMTKMAIESIVAIQDETTKYVSDFAITLKEIRTVSILNTTVDNDRFVTSNVNQENLYQGRSFEQSQDLSQIGNMSGVALEGSGDPLADALEAQRRRRSELSQ